MLGIERHAEAPILQASKELSPETTRGALCLGGPGWASGWELASASESVLG